MRIRDLRLHRVALALLLLLGASGPLARAQTEARIALRWSAVPAAVAYQLQIATDPDFRVLVVDTRVPLNGYRWAALPSKVHYWRVRSIDASGRAGEWSTPQELAPAVAAPQPLTPQNNAQVALEPRGVSFSAKSLPTLSRYVFELSRAESFSGEVLRTESAGPATWIAQLPVGNWFWRTRGIDLNGRTTSPSGARRLTVVPEAPRITQPAADLTQATVSPIAIGWTAARGATRFRIDVQPESGSVLSAEVSGRSDTFTPRGPGRYTITVRALENGTSSPPSPPRLITIGTAPRALTLLSPPERGAVNAAEGGADVSLRWKGVDAEDYAVELGTIAAPSESPTWQPPQHTRAPALGLHQLPVGRYAWRVTVRDRSGRITNQSEVGHFEVAAPAIAAPVLLGPDDDAVFAAPSVHLEWSTVPDAKGYELVAAPSGSFASAPVVPVNENAYEVDARSGTGEWSWQVRAIARNGTAGAWSGVRRFVIGPPAPIQIEVSASPERVVSGENGRGSIQVRVLDAQGRPVRGVTPVVEADNVQLSPLTPAGPGAFTATFEALPLPGPTELAQLRVRALGSEGSCTVEVLSGRSRLLAGASVGAFSTFGAFTGPELQLEVVDVTPWLSQRVRLLGRITGRYAEFTTPLPPGGQQATGHAWLWGASVLAAFAQPVGPVSLYAAVGPSAQLVDVSLPGQLSVTRPVFTAQLAAGAFLPIGRGEVTAELSGGFGQLTTPELSARASGLALTVGYRWSFR